MAISFYNLCFTFLGTDESGVFNLQILNATLSDEAEYECQVKRKSIMKKSSNIFSKKIS